MRNQAEGDIAQITDFAQTRHKCWVWWVNDHDKILGENILFPPS